ncbi:NACHT and WD repeat domain-containing protein [Nakamurella sp. GG22]
MNGGRHLLMIATAHYSDPDVWPDLGVDAETQVWRDWLTDSRLGERSFTVVYDDLARSPSGTRVDAVLREREGFDKSRDVLVCYITGHGEQHNREHCLILRTSVPGEKSTMLPTHRVLEWAMDRVETALVVVDTCYAGDIATFISSADRDLPAGWVVIAAASAHEQARLGVLTEAVRTFADTGADQDAQPYLDYWNLMRTLAGALEGQKWHPFGTPPGPSSSRLLTLPNRHYRPEVDERVPVASARQDVAMYVSDLVAHWDPRSRGVGDASTPGMLFTGRDRLMRTLISVAQGEPGSLVVTGVAGCGKSAVLSRLVTFSDPGFRARYAEAAASADAAGEPLPRVGDVDVAVLAKGSVAQSVLDAIRDRLGIPSVDGESVGDTIARIHRTQDGHRRITLVVDALDEAEDPRGIVTSVLSPLVKPPGAAWLRLLIGVRGSAPKSSGPHPVEDELAAATVRALSATAVDAAEPPYWTEADLAAYVFRLLRRPPDGEEPTPYGTADDDQLHELAGAVANIAGTSYVLARLVSDQLRRQSHPQDPADPAWQARSRASLAQILAAELEQDYPDPDRRRVAQCLLTGAALGRGRGAPRREIWPALAQALDTSGRRYTDTDIAALLDERIGGYLIRDIAENATVYRPFHDALARALTSSLDQDSRRRVTAGLLELFTIIQSHGLVVPPEEYLRRHAVEHAADSGDLDRVIRHPDVLTWTNPDHLLPLLSKLQDPEAQVIGRLYRTVAHTLGQQDLPPDTFALQLRVTQAGLSNFAAGLAGTAINPTGRLRWATPRQDSDHRRVDTPDRNECVCIGATPDGTAIIVSGGVDGMVGVWRLADGTPVVEPFRGHWGRVTSVAVAVLPDGTSGIVSSSFDSTVRVWRLADGTAVGEPLRTGHVGVVSAVAVLPDGTSVIVRSEFRAVQVFRLAEGTAVGEPLRTKDGGSVSAVAVAPLPDGSSVIVCGTDQGAVQVWRLVDGTPVGEPLDAHIGKVSSVTVGVLADGTSVIVSGGEDSTVRVLRLGDGTPVGEPLRGHDGKVLSVAVGALPNSTSVIASAGRDGTVRVWRLADGSPMGKPLRGHDWRVSSVAVGTMPDGTPVIVSGGWDRTVRVWPLMDGHQVGEPIRGHESTVTSVAIGKLPDGTPVAVSGSEDRTVRVWGLADGAAVGKPLSDHKSSVTSVAVRAMSDGTSVIVSGCGDGTVRVWRLMDGAPPLELSSRSQHGWVMSVAVGELPDATPLIVSGRDDSSVRVWQPLDGRRFGLTWSGHSDTVTSVAVGVLPGGTPVVVSGSDDRTVRVWRLADGAPMGEPLRGHDSWVTSVAIGMLPDGTHVIVSGSDDRTVRLWRLDDGAPMEEPLRGHRDTVTSVALGELRDGSPVIVSGSDDKTVRVWRVADGTNVGSPLKLQSSVTAIDMNALS